MKKIIILLLSLFAINSYSQIQVQNDGKVFFYSSYGTLMVDNSGHLKAITLRPQYDWVGHLGNRNKRYGDIWGHHIIAFNLDEDSDERIKENIVPVNNALDKIKKINGVKYNIKESFFKNIPDSTIRNKEIRKSKKQVGFVAQDLQKVFPELVHDIDNSGHYTVRYTGLIPVLVEAIKEQQVQIENMLTSQ